MTVSSSRPLLWMTLGSIAILAFSSITTTTVSAEQCPPPITVTKTEIFTVWADGSWPTKTVTQTVTPNDCPYSPQYSCYVVQTTTMAAQIPQATIHLVLPHGQDLTQTEVKDKMDALGLEAEGLDEVIQRMESMGFEAERFVATGGEPDYPEANVIMDPFPTDLPTLTIPDPGVPVLMEGPACVNYKTETVMGPCPTVTSLPLDKNGCAIVMSTALVMTAATAVPEINDFGKEDVEVTYSYTYIVNEEFGDGETSKKRKHHHKTHPHKHNHHSTTTAAAIAEPSTPTPPTVAPPAAHDVVISPPLEVTRTFEKSISTHVSYTLSFDFTYGTPSASPIPKPTPVLPQLPSPPPAPTAPTNPAEPPSAARTPAPEPKIEPTFTEPVLPPPPPPTVTSAPVEAASKPTPSPEDPSAIAPDDTEPADLTGIGSEDDLNIETGETSDPEDSIFANEAITPVVQDPPSLGPPTSSDQKTKACQACAEPCVVDLDVTAKAEVPLLQNLFETQLQKAIASLQMTLQNEISLSSSSSRPTKTAPMSPSSAENGQSMGALSAKLKMDAHTLDLFLKTVKDRCARLEAEYREKLKSRCEKVVHQDCVTGECLQREVDKAVQLLDVMLSTELAKDASQLRTEIVIDFRKKCEDHNDKVEKRGLFGGLLGDTLGGALDRTVESVTGVVDETVAKPLMGQSLVQPLVDGLTDSIKTVVDSFVRNCNRKGLLDFDTDEGVGTLAAITSVSLDLFKIVCIKAGADVKTDIKADL